jgi:hypothetical protein
MAVADLLMSQRRWGQTRCRRFLSQIPMSEKKTIGSMTERQRRTLAPMLDSGETGRAPSQLVGPPLVAATQAGDHSVLGAQQPDEQVGGRHILIFKRARMPQRRPRRSI